MSIFSVVMGRRLAQEVQGSVGKEVGKQHGLNQYRYTLLLYATIFLMKKTCNSTTQNRREHHGHRNHTVTGNRLLFDGRTAHSGGTGCTRQGAGILRERGHSDY